jgi:hypothetical protein
LKLVKKWLILTIGEFLIVVVCMSLYSTGKNEIQSLLTKEGLLMRELTSLGQSRCRCSDIKSFREIAIRNEMSRIRNKLAVLSFGRDLDDDGIA